MQLTVTSCQSANAYRGFAAIITWAFQETGLAPTLENACDWEERYARLDRHEIDLAWVCGAPYVRRDSADLELLAAPVMLGEQYENRPIYFSNVLVRHDYPAQTFADLRGTTFAINEPGSQSGAITMAYQLAKMGKGWDYFGRVVQSGAHLNSVRLIQAGKITAAAIDSTVYDIEVANDPTIANVLRIVNETTKMPIPPYVIGRWVPAEIRAALRDRLVCMDQSPTGCAILHRHGYRRFHPVTDPDYDFIRESHRIASANLPIPTEKFVSFA